MDRIDEWIEESWSDDLTLGEWWHRLFRSGLAFPTWPVGLGGRGVDGARARRISTALAAAGTIAAPEGPGPNMGAPTVLAHGTPDQQQRFVAPLARGRTQWCQLFSEPGAGSDLASLATRAELDGDDYVVTGQKVWSSRADRSDWGMLLCRTDLDAPKHRGITFLLLDMDQPGVEVRPIVQMNGGAEFCEVFLTEARARTEDVIGAPDDGWAVARTTLAHERASTGRRAGRGAIEVEAGGRAGNLDRRVGDLVAEARTRKGHGRQRALLGSRAMTDLARRTGTSGSAVDRDRLMRFHVHAEVYRLNGQRARDLARARVPSPLDGSLLKLDLAGLAHEARDLSLALLGADGMRGPDTDTDHGRIVRTALTSFVPSLGGGTNEVQRTIVGERTLGLPREPSVDSDVAFRDLRRSPARPRPQETT